MTDIPPLVIGRVSYFGNSPFIVMALGGAGKGFDTLEAAMIYRAKVPDPKSKEPQQLFQLVGTEWIEIKTPTLGAVQAHCGLT